MALRLTAVDEPRNPTPAGLALLRKCTLHDMALCYPWDQDTSRLLIADGWATFQGTAAECHFIELTEAGCRALAEAQREIEAPREQAA